MSMRGEERTRPAQWESDMGERTQHQVAILLVLLLGGGVPPVARAQPDERPEATEKRRGAPFRDVFFLDAQEK